MEIEAAKVIGAGLAVIGVIGSGIGIGNIFSSFIEAAVSYTHLTLPTIYSV